MRVKRNDPQFLRQFCLLPASVGPVSTLCPRWTPSNVPMEPHNADAGGVSADIAFMFQSAAKIGEQQRQLIKWSCRCRTCTGFMDLHGKLLYLPVKYCLYEPFAFTTAFFGFAAMRFIFTKGVSAQKRKFIKLPKNSIKDYIPALSAKSIDFIGWVIDGVNLMHADGSRHQKLYTGLFAIGKEADWYQCMEGITGCRGTWMICCVWAFMITCYSLPLCEIESIAAKCWKWWYWYTTTVDELKQ